MPTNNRQQLLTVAAIGAAAFFAGDRLLFTPLTTWWKERSSRIQELRQKVASGEELVKRGAVIRGRWSDMRTNTLPASTSEEQVSKAVEDWSRESGLSITGLTPQWKRDAEDYSTLVCRVDAFGNVESVSRFLYDIEKSPLALKLESIEMSARDNNGQQIALGLQISGLVLNSETK